MAMFERFADLMLSHLLWTSLQAAMLVAVIALVLRLLPRLPAAARCALWWLVTLQVVLGLAWQSPIRLPLLSSPAVVTMQLQYHAASADSGAEAAPAVVSSPAHGWEQRISWREGLLALWVLAVLAQAPALVAERRRLRALLRDSQPADPPLQERCAELAKLAGLRRCPRLRASGRVEAPLAAGWWRPLILWPNRQTLSADETSLALAHELAHLKRGDLWLGIVPALAWRLLFFHPLVRWAVHEYAAYREAACDAAAVGGREHDAQGYGALLLRLGVSGARVAGISAASETFRNLKLRLTMLRQPAASMLRVRVWILIVAVAMLGALPYRVVAANHASHSSATGTHTTATRPDNESTFTVYGGMAANFPNPHARIGYALVARDLVLIYGTKADIAAASSMDQSHKPLLWFRRDGKVYMIHDKALIARARVITKPVADTFRYQIGMDIHDDGLLRHIAVLQREQDTLDAADAAAEADYMAVEANHAAQSRSDRSGTDSLKAAQAKMQATERETAQRRKALQAQIQALDAKRKQVVAKQNAAFKAQANKAEQRAEQPMEQLLDIALRDGLAKPAD